MNGFENYLAAAFERKKVPLTVVADQARAAYVIMGTSEGKKPGAMKMLVFGQIHADNAASIQMVDQRTSAVVFAYAVNKKEHLAWGPNYGWGMCKTPEREVGETVDSPLPKTAERVKSRNPRMGFWADIPSSVIRSQRPRLS